MKEFKGDKRTKEYKQWKAEQSKGLGDTIEKVLKATGIDKVAKFILGEDCGCDERKAKLNKMFPYKTECLQEQEHEYLKDFFSVRRNVITAKQQGELIVIYNRVFNEKREGSNCAPCVKSMINELDRVFKEY